MVRKIEHRGDNGYGRHGVYKCTTCGGELYIRKYGAIIQIGCSKCGRHVGVGRGIIQLYKSTGADWLHALYDMYIIAARLG